METPTTPEKNNLSEIEDSQPGAKILEYIDRAKAGETLESFGDIPESWKEEIRKGLHIKEINTFNASFEKQQKIDDLKNDIDQVLDRPYSLEELSGKLLDLYSRYYFLSHQTDVRTAETINKEGFLFQAGGLNTTMLSQGPQGVIESLKKMQEGESHRGVDGMIIVAVPKDEFEKYAHGGKFSPDAFADMLVEKKLDEITKTGDLRIPIEYNLGTYDKAKGFTFNPQYR